MRSSERRTLLIAGGAAVLALAVFVLLTDRSGPDPANASNEPDNSAQQPDDLAPQQEDADQQQDDQQSPPPTPPALQPIAEGLSPSELYETGLQLLQDGQLLQARSALSQALFSEQLSDAQAENARTQLTDLANKTLFSGTVYEGDPYVFRYELEPGDTLIPVERDLELHVPWQLIMQVNDRDDPTALRAGETLTMVRGPFHAIVDKSAFTMDIYLHREGLERIFIVRLPVGLGRNNGTPTGMWRLRLGGKLVEQDWFPPSSSNLQGPISHDHPDYPFGDLGLWISLEGTDENTQFLHGYGIHSTSQPDTIGQMASLGCIRLADPDIQVVFTLLYEQWSTVEVRP